MDGGSKERESNKRKKIQNTYGSNKTAPAFKQQSALQSSGSLSNVIVLCCGSNVGCSSFVCFPLQIRSCIYTL